MGEYFRKSCGWMETGYCGEILMSHVPWLLLYVRWWFTTPAASATLLAATETVPTRRYILTRPVLSCPVFCEQCDTHTERPLEKILLHNQIKDCWLVCDNSFLTLGPALPLCTECNGKSLHVARMWMNPIMAVALISNKKQWGGRCNNRKSSHYPAHALGIQLRLLRNSCVCVWKWWKWWTWNGI